MRAFLRDIAYAARQLRRAPAFATAAILTMALGIGANTAIFSVVYGLLLESLPFRDAASIIGVSEVHPRVRGSLEATFPDYRNWRTQQTSFEQLAAYSVVNPNTVSLQTGDGAQQVHRILASGNFFSVLGVQAMLGRTLTDRDDFADGSHVAVLSNPAWQKYFGADRAIVGRSIQLNGTAYTVVGVLPARGEFSAAGEVWLPLASLDKATQASRVWHSVRVLGRLKPGVSATAAQTEMQTIASRLASIYPATNRDETVRLTPLREQLIGTLRPALLCVMGCVVLVLLIACANVANLLLVRASALEHDRMVREALGATRTRLFSQHLAQSGLICCMGGVLGIAISFLSLPLLRAGLTHSASVDETVISAIHLSWPVLGTTASVCAVTAALFGFLPLSMPRLAFGGPALAGSRSFTSRHIGRGALIGTEIAIAVVVSFLGFLMMRSFQRIMAVDPGYRTDHLLTFEMTLPQPRYQDASPQTQQFYDQLLAKLKATPGIQAAATTTQLPMHPSLVMTRFLIQGEAPVTAGSYPLAQMRFVTPDFFGTMGLAIESGRTFTRDEFSKGDPVVLVNRTFAKRFLRGRDPIGAKVVLGVLNPQPVTLPVIGVVGDAHEVGIEAETPPEIFLAGFGVHEVLLVRTDADPGSLIPSIQRLLKQIDPGVPIYNVQSLDEVLSQSIALQRITTILLGAFAVLALVLATIGIYGVLAYSVAQHTREIGVRMAVGAQRADIALLFLRKMLLLAGVGVVSGLMIAFLCARAMNSLLFRTGAMDTGSALGTMAHWLWLLRWQSRCRSDARQASTQQMLSGLSS